jgi:hypothetical protein
VAQGRGDKGASPLVPPPPRWRLPAMVPWNAHRAEHTWQGLCWQLLLCSGAWQFRSCCARCGGSSFKGLPQEYGWSLGAVRNALGAPHTQ